MDTLPPHVLERLASIKTQDRAFNHNYNVTKNNMYPLFKTLSSENIGKPHARNLIPSALFIV